MFPKMGMGWWAEVGFRDVGEKRKGRRMGLLNEMVRVAVGLEIGDGDIACTCILTYGGYLLETDS